MYGDAHIAKQLEGWWKDHAGQEDDPDWNQYLDTYFEMLDNKLRELKKKHDNDGRFGMASTSGCTRKAGLKMLGHKEDFKGSTQLTFWIGHQLEIAGLCTLLYAGYPLYGAQAPVRIDPMMHSYHDEVTTIDGIQTIVSVKSAAYKMSSFRNGKYVRQGFPELPFEGVRASQPSWWAQAQAEMRGSDIKQTLMLVVAKDVVQAFENDPYMASTSFYTEIIPADPAFADTMEMVWQQQYLSVQGGSPGPALILPKGQDAYVRIPIPGDDSRNPQHANRQATGTFNPCGWCGLREACTAEYAKGYRGGRS